MTQRLWPETSERSRCEAVATIYSRLLATSVVNALNAGLIVAVMTEGRRAPGAIEWLALMILLSITRATLYFRYRADPDKAANSPRWARLAVIGSFFAGLLWGLGPIAPFSAFSTHLWFWAFVIGGMCAGATSLHAAHLPTALAFMIPASLPLAGSLLLQDTLQGYAAAVMTLAFIATMTFTATLTSREFSRMQDLKLALELRAAEMDQINGRLSHEIADHRTTVEALHQSQKMEALGNLTGGFAHDFNNILTVILNNLDTIHARTAQGRIRELALSATSAAESGADLLSRLLAFARKQPLEPRLCNVVDIVADFRDLLMHAVSGPVHVAFDFAVPVAAASLDVSQLQSMLLNLVVNARDAMPPTGGLITIRVSRALLDDAALRGTEAQPGDYVAIAVRDDGLGMAPEALDRAFEPFYTTKADRGGTGLGLAQVYGFARQSGGFGHIDSAPGKGTCITIFIPAVDASQLPTPGSDERACPSSRPSSARPCSVLLVDDNMAVLRALKTGLAAEGWEVLGTGEAGAVLDIVASRPFDIVVTDIDMPGEMNGRQLAAELRRRHPDLPILLMSGAPPDGDGAVAAFPFLIKPFRKQVFMEKVQSLLR